MFFAVILLLSFGSVVPSATAASLSGTTFTPLNAIWGTSSNQLEAAPGSQNMLLTISIAYNGGVTATSILATLRLPAGMVDVYGNAAPTTGTTGISANTIFTLSYYLNIANSFATGTYNVPIQFSWSTTAGGTFVVNAETDNIAINVLGTATLNFRSAQTSLNSGQVNTVQVTLSNTGTGAATQVTPTVSTSGSSVSILSTLPTIASLGPGGLQIMNISLYVPSSLAGSSISLSFSTSFSDPYGVSKTITQSIGLYAVSVPVPILNFNSRVQSVVPGGVNEIPVTLSNLGPGSVARIYTTISVPSQFGVLNQFPTIGTLIEGSNVTANVKLFVPTSAGGTSAPLTFTSTYIDAYGTSRTTTQTLGLYVLGSSSINTYSSISISVLNNSLVAGQISPVTFTVKNIGTLPLHSPTITLTVSSPLVVSGNASYSWPGRAIRPGESVTYRAMILSSVGATGGSYPGTLTVQYTDAYGDSPSQTYNVGFALVTQAIQLSVDTLSSDVWLGNTSFVSFQIRNIGTATMYSPVFSLSTPSPLAVTINSTFSRPGLNLKPGQQLRYEAAIANGPKTAEGAYVSTLTVTYLDQFGNSHSASFPVGVVVTGAIQFVIQDEQVIQTAGGVAISGTLLNEGAASAFYTRITANITGSSKLGSGSAYVGEVDPNTPLPFSITIAIPSVASSQSAKILLSATYQNDFGKVLKTAFAQTSTNLLSSGQLAQQGSSQTGRGSGQQTGVFGLTNIVLVAVIAILVVVVVVFVRRRGKRGKAEARSEGNKNGKVF